MNIMHIYWISTALAAGSCALLVSCGGGSSTSAEPPPAAPDISALCPTPSVTQLDIETENRQPVESLEQYVRTTLHWSSPFAHSANMQARIRGRGNSTWHMDKKPYKLKLDEKAPLLGMPAGKDWALLANHADKTLLRNELSFCIARTLGLPYTPDSRMAEVTLNGSYDGVYQLTNKTYPAEDRVKADLQQNGDSATFNDAFVLEVDFALRETHWFHSQSGMPYNFTSDNDAQQRARIQAWFNELETIIADRSDPHRLAKVGALVDLQSLADFYLATELTASVDTYQSSTYVYRLRDGRLTFGPVWDFDQALGPTQHNHDPRGWLLLERPYNWYFREMLNEPGFAELVQQRWRFLRDRVPSYLQFARNAATALDEAQRRNFVRWPILDEYVFSNVIALGSYQAEVNYMVQWLEQRARWIDANTSAWAPAKTPASASTAVAP